MICIGARTTAIGLAVWSMATPAAEAATFTALTAVITDGALRTESGGIGARTDLPGDDDTLSHALTGVIDADITPAALAADPAIPNFYTGRALITASLGSQFSDVTLIDGVTPKFGPFSFNDAFASPLFGLFSLTIMALEAEPTGNETIDFGGTLGDVTFEWDFSAITLTETTIDGAFHLGLVNDLSGELTDLLGLPLLPGEIDYAAEFAIDAHPVPAPAAGPLLLAGLGVIAALRRRRA